MKKQKGYTLPICILALAAILRFWNYAGWSLSNDELSALLRLRFDSLGEMITNGVRPDFHPAGIQVLLYGWIKLFGDAPWVVRLPFVLFGTGSVWLTFLIGRRWFGWNAGILAMSAVTVLQLPLLYSQIARPYSPGMFFCLLMVYFWTRILIGKEANIRTMLGYGISTALCLYDHYFAIVFAALVGLTGILFLPFRFTANGETKTINSKVWTFYLSGGFIAILLFLPHLSISAEQLSRGGLESWLGPPESDFYLKFLGWNLYNSVWFAGLIAFIFILGLLTVDAWLEKTRLKVVALLWFIIPAAFGYYYSVHVNPILQYSVLIFPFPFLILFVSGWFGEDQPLGIPSALLILFFGVLTINGKYDFYNRPQFGEFRNIAEKSLFWKKVCGEKNIAFFYNMISPEYIDYYFRHLGDSVKYTFHRGDDENFLLTADSFLKNTNADYIVYAWSNNRHPSEFPEMINYNYPILLDWKKYFNAEIVLFYRDAEKKFRGWDPAFFTSFHPYDRSNRDWQFDKNKLDTMQPPPYPWGLNIAAEDEFPLTYQTSIGRIFPDTARYGSAYVHLKSDETTDIRVTFEVSRNDSVIHWQAMSSKTFYKKQPDRDYSGTWFSFKKPAGALPADKVKLYLWNPDKHKSTLYHFGINVNYFSNLYQYD